MRNTVHKMLVAALMVCSVCLALTASAKEKEAKIDFKEDVYDFGKVSVKDGKVSHEFEFTNIGSKNLVITDAKADCGCTRPEYSDEPVAPKKKGSVKVTFVPNGKGTFTKKVTIVTNGNPRKSYLRIKGEVVP